MHRPSARASLILIVLAAALGLPAGAALAHPGSGLVVYINRGGGTVSAGDDDSARGTSSLVERGSVKIPAWKGGEARWKRVMSCVRDRFSAFDLDITEERPQQGAYIMAMVGGQPSLLGYDRDVSGIAPYTGEVMPAAIVYIFAAGVDYDVEITCVDVLHEVGHALGLDHEMRCQDPMSYQWNCEGPKTFQDAEAACGEDDARACETGRPTQNTFRILARDVGLRPGARLPERAVSEPAPPRAPSDDGDRDRDGELDATPAAAPAISVDGPSGVVAGNRELTLVVHGKGQRLSDAALAWLAPDGRYTLSCGAMPPGGGATCVRRGDDFVFHIEVGTGWRYFAATIRDADGASATSEPASVYLK